MKSQVCAIIVVNYLLLGTIILQASAFKVLDHDLTVAESKKHDSWDKGEESDFFEHGEHEKGEKGEKGYESKHG